MKTLADKLREQAEQAKHRPAPGPLAGFPFLQEHALVGAAAHAAAAARPIAYVWQGIVCPGNVVLVGGGPGEGKTTLFALMFVARRNRTGVAVEILGRLMNPAPPEKYLVMIQQEHGETSNSRKLARSCEAMGLPGDTLEMTISLARKDVMVGSRLWEEVCRLAARGLVDSIWIDSLARFQDSDSNSEEAQAAVFGEVQAAIESAPGHEKPTAWIVAHARKASSGADVSDIAGSVQRAAQADVVLLVKAERDESLKVISARVAFAKIREDDGDWPTAASFSIARGEDGKVRVAWDASAKVEDQPAHERVHALLSRDGAMTKQKLRDALGLSGDRLEKALSVLFAERRIKRDSRTVRGQRRDHFKVDVSTKDLFTQIDETTAHVEARSRKKGAANDGPF